MKRFLKIVALLVGCLLAFIVYVQLTYNRKFTAPPTGITARTDSASIARGRYIVKGPAHCWTCHAPKTTALKAGMHPSERDMMGGVEFKTPVATFYTPNITPDKETGIGRFTDDQVARAIRYGVNHSNDALAPFMMFQSMNDEDLTAVVSYLRATKPVHNEVPARDLNLLGKIISRFMLEPNLAPEVMPAIAPDTTAHYGNYIVEAMANCRSCHTKRDKASGKFIGEPFAGGNEMENETESGGTFVTPNLTPDSTTGRIYTWTSEQFVARFKLGHGPEGSHMPWEAYAQMTDNDLKAIYKFLKTLTPVQNKVERTFIPKEN
ncbi:c-type cytochrome [Chryseolinea lacunae]|uniref:C-type cytochrome n=1 Tax=Chryseolinea lacunae TaxID=2801331 RepID=A0ABS1KT26_9BACT|nr:c-type cytochrome [Chryseolinea lacunae]MBL0742619.1 c-type cytochrome [Chryseolinea lacunae]